MGAQWTNNQYWYQVTKLKWIAIKSIMISFRETLTILMLGSSNGGVYHCRATATNSQCQTQYSNGRTVNSELSISAGQTLSSSSFIGRGKWESLTCNIKDNIIIIMLLFSMQSCDFVAPPTISSLPLNTINILEGQSLQISCEADGYPEPTYEVS